jgi:hypothetical protein
MAARPGDGLAPRKQFAPSALLLAPRRESRNRTKVALTHGLLAGRIFEEQDESLESATVKGGQSGIVQPWKQRRDSNLGFSAPLLPA